MADQNVKRQLNEEETFFYEDKVCGESDVVYRFCLALTLDSKEAVKLLNKTYLEAAKRINECLACSASELKTLLLQIAYGNFAPAQSSAGKGESPLLNYLGMLEVAERAATVAFDVAGLNTAEVADVLGKGNEGKVRHLLASARRKLIEKSKFV